VSRLASISTEALRVLDYLVRHAGARDTVEGVVQWWLMEERLDYVARKVERGLKTLVKKGLIAAEIGPDQRTHYRLRPEKKQEAERLLAKHRNESHKP